MKSKRIENDLRIAWTITTNGKAESLEGRALTLSMRSALGWQQVADFAVSGNTVTFIFRGSEQKVTGVYLLKLQETTGGGMRTIDVCRAFQLVPHSYQEDDPNISDLDDPNVALKSDVQVGMPGLSAYEIWLKRGHTGSEADFIAWCKGKKGAPFRYEDFTEEQLDSFRKPAIDAAATVRTKIEELNADEKIRTSAELTRQGAESVRKNNEKSREKKYAELTSSAEALIKEVEDASAQVRDFAAKNEELTEKTLGYASTHQLVLPATKFVVFDTSFLSTKKTYQGVITLEKAFQNNVVIYQNSSDSDMYLNGAYSPVATIPANTKSFSFEFTPDANKHYLKLKHNTGEGISATLTFSINSVLDKKYADISAMQKIETVDKLLQGVLDGYTSVDYVERVGCFDKKLSEVSTNNSRMAVIEVKEDEYYIVRYANHMNAYTVFADNSKNIIGSNLINEDGGIIILRVPAGATRLYISTVTRLVEKISVKRINKDVFDSVFFVNKTLDIKEQIWEMNNIVHTSGEVGNINVWKHSPYYDIRNAKYLRFNNLKSAGGYNHTGLAFYDRNKAYISGVPYVVGAAGLAIIPGNAEYVRISEPTDKKTFGSQEIEIGYNSVDYANQVSQKLRGIKPAANNLANPLYETVKSYNEHYPATEIKQELVFSKKITDGGVGDSRRIPAVIITNAETYLCACEDRPSASDYSNTGIMLARRVKDGSAWSYSYPLPYLADEKIKYMNISFVVDRTGAHSVKGRIFIFFMQIHITEKNKGALTSPGTTSDDIDAMYIYSDDDGVNWSSKVSCKQNWDTSVYRALAPAPSNGIQLTDGTLVVPCTGWMGTYNVAGIMYKRVSDLSWQFSPRTLMNNDNECTVWEGLEPNSIYLSCRNESPACLRPVYQFDIDKKQWRRVEENFDAGQNVEASIIKMTSNNRTYFLYSIPDPIDRTGSPENKRRRTTVWLSIDGLTWMRVLRLKETSDGLGKGYSNLAEYNGKLAVIYEDYNECSFIDLTNAIHLFDKSYDILKREGWREEVMMEKLLGVYQ